MNPTMGERMRVAETNVQTARALSQSGELYRKYDMVIML